MSEDDSTVTLLFLRMFGNLIHELGDILNVLTHTLAERSNRNTDWKLKTE